MPPVRARPRASFFTGGGRFPPIIGLVIFVTVVASIVGAIGERNGFPLLRLGALIPDRLVHGEVWRLFTWIFFEREPIALVFACLSMYWFGRDLAYRFGPTRFVLMYLGGAALVGAATFAIAQLYSPLGAGAWVGSWPMQEALIILWASYYPTRQIRVYFVVPLGGRQLILLTLAGTVLFAIFYGVASFVPHFVAELIALAFVNLPSPRQLWLESKLRGMEQKRRTHLKAVPRESSDDDKPPSGRWLN